ncbi:glycosyltransferase [Microbacterium sp. NIBRBAC000506063]|uniref:glycosyltransferase n=1 Tax=Microbacterium sp. NIBRBAC000506063 TaxID=2734618 RepID=UPI001BB4ED1A|nr:glycosyltransferase [Microbacterium sp. NIBRBAC000506063]QTV80624.1 hypothetical protein KAE78_03910 [Microbacterium sp. NIBRBAC000506063]
MPGRGAENHDLLPYGQFLDLCREADAVVLQGGAGAVMDMRSIGVVPIVVPRVPGGGEVVDEHQLVFAQEMDALGVIRRALTYEEFARLLDEALLEGRKAPAEIATPGADRVEALLSRPVRRITVWLTLRRMAKTGVRILRTRLRRGGPR